jgi:hypothetical protein
MDAQSVFDRARALEDEGRLDDSVDLYAAIVRESWRDVAPYARLLHIHLHRRDVDAAWCAASMLAVLEQIEDDVRELLEDYTPRRLPVPGRLDASDWELLRDRNEDAAVAPLALLRSVLRAPPIANEPGLDTAALKWAADALGAEASIAVTDPEIAPRSSLYATHHMFMLRERLFFAGREATSYLGPYYELRRCSLRDVTKALGAQAQGDVGAWHRALTSTRVRAGVLVCGEPLVAHRLLVAEGAPEEAMAELAAFTISKDHLRLRKKLGVAVGLNADVVGT